jgi:hypothetical protein
MVTNGGSTCLLILSRFLLVLLFLTLPRFKVTYDLTNFVPGFSISLFL